MKLQRERERERERSSLLRTYSERRASGSRLVLRDRIEERRSEV